MVENNDSQKNLKWPISLIDAIVQARNSDEYKVIFANAKTTLSKKKAWEDLAETIDQSGRGKEINDKYKDLLKIYRAKLAQKRLSGGSPVTWKYFEIFEEYLGSGAEAFPHNTSETFSINDKGDFDRSENTKKKLKKNNTNKVEFQNFIKENMKENLELKKEIVKNLFSNNDNNTRIEKIENEISEIKNMFGELIKKLNALN